MTTYFTWDANDPKGEKLAWLSSVLGVEESRFTYQVDFTIEDDGAAPKMEVHRYAPHPEHGDRYIMFWTNEYGHEAHAPAMLPVRRVILDELPPEHLRVDDLADSVID